jgi:hypothetical protein
LSAPVVLLLVAVLTGVELQLIAVGWHFPGDQRCGASFHILVAICMSFMEKCLGACFYIGFFFFLLPSYRNFFYSLEINLLLDMWSENIFSYFTFWLFTLLIAFFAGQNVFIDTVPPVWFCLCCL